MLLLAYLFISEKRSLMRFPFVSLSRMKRGSFFNVSYSCPTAQQRSLNAAYHSQLTHILTLLLHKVVDTLLHLFV